VSVVGGVGSAGGGECECDGCVHDDGADVGRAWLPLASPLLLALLLLLLL